MASVAFFILTVGLILGLLWTLQEMIVKGKWTYFIFFLVGFLPIYISFLSLTYLNTRSELLVSVFQALKEVAARIVGSEAGKELGVYLDYISSGLS
jgi:hypothetical protein